MIRLIVPLVSERKKIQCRHPLWKFYGTVMPNSQRSIEFCYDALVRLRETHRDWQHAWENPKHFCSTWWELCYRKYQYALQVSNMQRGVPRYQQQVELVIQVWVATPCQQSALQMIMALWWPMRCSTSFRRRHALSQHFMFLPRISPEPISAWVWNLNIV